LFGSIVIPPILTILNDAFGFQGAPGAGPNALAAPQARSISADRAGRAGRQSRLEPHRASARSSASASSASTRCSARSKRGSLPPLAVGMGIYLPMSLTLLIPVGAFLGWTYDKVGRPVRVRNPTLPSGSECSWRPASSSARACSACLRGIVGATDNDSRSRWWRNSPGRSRWD
jgi:uncharacterized oligopeptide transporter (OPT) family protein